MTPLQLARDMADHGDAQARALAVAMVARSLSDDDPSDPFRQGWDREDALRAAARHLSLDATPALIDSARRLMPSVSDALLNRRS